MARTQQVVETVTCDLCGRPADPELTTALGWNGEQWQLDLCRADHRRVAGQFDKWIAKGETMRSSRGRRRRAQNGAARQDDWAYLESLGFRRHRGRKSAQEIEALANRSS